MKKSILAAALLAATLSFNSAHAQMAAKKNITMDELLVHLNGLLQKGDDASKAELLKEADAMAKSKDEQFVSMSTRVYGSIAQEAKAKQVETSILKKFPKGIKARGEAYSKAFDPKLNLTGAQFEAAHSKWLKQFPAKSFAEKDRGMYGNALSAITLQYAKEKNLDKVNSYITDLKNTPNYVAAVSSVSSELLKQGQHAAALEYLEDAYKITQAAVNGADARTNPNSRYNSGIASSLGQALLENGQTDKAIEILTKTYATSPSEPTLLALTSALTKQGKDLDAFILLQGHITKNGKNEKVLGAITPIYSKLNNNKGDFAAFEAGLDKQIKEALESKYKSEMIKKEAPAFSLVNLEGKTVSLADMKGKIVVLDFWAIWCGPCVMSFPGMQASVDKYKDDKDVEFLFINTWQNEENYVDLVHEFLKENKYRFNVLFDEMKEKDKATVTAYGVKGIPTKVFIDKEGFIRFESSGGSADVQKVVNEMVTKIELIKKG